MLMSSSIKAIDRASIHRICSGQVVLDLATCVKEIVENSLDAGATSLEIRLREYGSDLIEVADDGKGIQVEDYTTVAAKYHTSKISVFEDVASVMSFGFRGEAISSICAVADVTITTRAQGQNVGAKLTFNHDGVLIGTEPVARSIGTTVAIRDLFSTLPVRRKSFLRGLKREYSKLVLVLQAYCLISSGVKVIATNQVKNGARSTLVCTQGRPNMADNIQAVFGAKQFATLEPLIAEDDRFKVRGYISSALKACGRGQLVRQFLFLNGRPVDQPKIPRLINELFRSLSSPATAGCKAVYVLDLHVAAEHCDVNVTPDKRTVMIQHEAQLLELIRATLQDLWDPAKWQYAVSLQQSGLKGVISTGRCLHAPQDLAVPASDLREDAESDGVGAKEAPDLPQRQFSAHPLPAANRDRVLETEDDKGALEDNRVIGSRALSTKRARLQQALRGMSRIGGPGTDAKAKLADTVLIDCQRQDLTKQDDADCIPDGAHTSPAGGCGEVGATRLSPPSTVGRASRIPGALARCLAGTAGATSRCRIAVSREVYGGDFAEVHGSSVPADQPTESPRLQPLGAPGVSQHVDVSPDTPGLGGPTSEQTAAPVTRRLPELQGIDPDGPVTASCIAETGESMLLGQVLEPDPEGICPQQDPLGGHEQMPCDALGNREDQERADGTVQMHASSSRAASFDASGPPRPAEALQGLDGGLSASLSSSRGEVVNEFVPAQASHSDIKVDLAGMRSRRTSRNQRAADGGCCALQASYHASSLQALDVAGSVDDKVHEHAVHELERVFNKAHFRDMRVHGQFNLGFIMASVAGDLFIIDQHAADEKYNFERLRDTTVLNKQPLLAPSALDLTLVDEMTLREHMGVFEQNGFDFKECADTGQLTMTAVPFSKGVTFGVEDVHELIALLQQGGGQSYAVGKKRVRAGGDQEAMSVPRPSKVRDMLAMRACRGSIMIGKALSPAQMQITVARLSDLDSPWNCPHGRPTMRHVCNLRKQLRT